MKNPFSWYHNRYHKFIHCKVDTSEVIMSRAMFNEIQKNNPEATQFNVLFTKIKGKDDRVEYAMLFNPDWSKHGADGNRIMTVPVTLGKFGHIGFQSIQPSVAEICAMYGKTGGEVELKVETRDFAFATLYVIKR